MTEPELVDIDLNPDLEDAQFDHDYAPRDTVPEPNLRPEGIVHTPIPDLAVPHLTLDFDSAYLLLRQDMACSGEPTTSSQQSKLINYVDEQLLHVQRSFIRSQADDSVKYLLTQLLLDLTRIIEIIHVSLKHSGGHLYGQDEYFIRIMGDLEDYITHYAAPFTVKPEFSIFSPTDMQLMTRFFAFFQSLDLHLSLLIDGLDNNGDKLRTTQFVRLIAVTNRLRIFIVEKIDPVRAKLVHIMDRNKDAHALMAQQYLNLIDSEVGRLFEGILNRESLV